MKLTLPKILFAIFGGTLIAFSIFYLLPKAPFIVQGMFSFLLGMILGSLARWAYKK